MNKIPLQVPNPSDNERHEILKFLLSLDNRLNDFNDIINLMSPLEDIEKNYSKFEGRGKKIAVLGAGVAGLCSAYELNKIGCDITVFEASNRIGGRIKTHYFDKANNQCGELGAMRISVSHETTWHYIKKFKLKTIPFISKSVSSLFFVRGSYANNEPNGKSIIENIYPQFNLTKDERITALGNLIGKMYKKYFYSLTSKERSELVRIKPTYSHKIREIQNLSLRQAYENSGLSQDAVSMISYLSALEADLLHISLFEILAELYTCDFAFTYTIDGGMINLPLEFYKNIINSSGPGKVKFKFGNAVSSIIKSPYRDKVLLEVVNTNDKTCYYEEFDYIVCAIPFSSLRRINIKPSFSPSKMQAINEVNYEIGQKTFLYLKERFWEKDKLLSGTTLTDLITISTLYSSDHLMPIENKLNHYKLKPNVSYKEPGVLLASYNWNQNAVRLGNELDLLKLKKIQECMELIHRLPEGYIDNNLLDYASILWSNVPFIWGGLCLMTPGQKELFLYHSTTPEMDNKVFFAGEHASVKHGWQEGALQSAQKAANSIAKLIRDCHT